MENIATQPSLAGARAELGNTLADQILQAWNKYGLNNLANRAFIYLGNTYKKPNSLSQSSFSIGLLFYHIKALCKTAYTIGTSPPSAREAAMSAMKLESFLETSMKHSGNTLDNHETLLKIVKHP